MEDRLQHYRQPLVTATGIILGFVLTFANQWVKSDSPLSDAVAYLVGCLVLAGMCCLILVLSRILRVGVPAEEFERYYTRTVRLFVTGVSLAVAGATVEMYANFLLG